jgi:YYY domain-containing protein
MAWSTMIWLMVTWYVTVQVVALAVLPLTLRVMRALPDRGYSLAKISGILLTGLIFWLAVSYGLLRNERGGAWVALLIVAVTSWLVGYGDIGAWWRSLRGTGGWRAVITIEVIFALAFVGWAIVRVHDPAANHTEQPMDLMFMNSIWSSPTFPPQDAWLAGYGISYYYLGYWLLTTLGRLAGTTPNLAYNLGQAVWYGYLWLGCFAVVMNLLAWRFSREATADATEQVIYRIPGWSLAGGVLGGVAVALIGNLQGIIEWLYAQGVDVSALAEWIDVRNFPQNASQTGQWFISYDWWWWRSSRIIGDTDVAGNYIELIDEFPMFSYLLGDNHPHVMAMPVVLLVVGLALNLFLLLTQRQLQTLPGEEPLLEYMGLSTLLVIDGCSGTDWPWRCVGARIFDWWGLVFGDGTAVSALFSHGAKSGGWHYSKCFLPNAPDAVLGDVWHVPACVNWPLAVGVAANSSISQRSDSCRSPCARCATGLSFACDALFDYRMGTDAVVATGRAS